MKPLEIKWYGWKPDRPDARDHTFKPKVARLLASADLRADCPPHMNQGELGACVAHGVSSCLRFAMKQQGLDPRPLSRLQMYYDGRVIESTVTVDSGLTIRDGIKCAADIGIAPEPLWPYNIDRFTQKPFPRVYARALQFRALKYERVEPNAYAIKAAIASGHPVVGGFNVFRQFGSASCARNGVVAMPGTREAPVGGHCLYFCAYGQKPGYITARNSWGDDWGDKGDCYFPEEFLEQQASDFWIVTQVSVK